MYSKTVHKLALECPSEPIFVIFLASTNVPFLGYAFEGVNHI